MKSVNKIFVILFLICALWPFGEFFINQWRAAERLTLSDPVTVCRYTTTTFTVTTGESVTLTDYIINNCADINGDSVIGLTRLFARIPATVLLHVSNSSSLKTVSLTHILAFSGFFSRTVYVFLTLFAVYIMLLPFFMIAKFWRSKT